MARAQHSMRSLYATRTSSGLPMLIGFQHIIIDEVHERTIESDFLLIVLKSLLAQRSDLKCVPPPIQFASNTLTLQSGSF